MPVNPSVPLGALLVTAGFLAAGFAADAGAIDQRIDGFIDVQPDAQIEVTQATGQGDGETVELLHLTVETATQANLSRLEVLDEHDRELAVLDAHPIRDEDGSLAHGQLDSDDMARVVVDLAEPMEPGEVQGFVLVLDGGEDTELVVETPLSLEDGYTRLEHTQR